jgi:hypothetical protein
MSHVLLEVSMNTQFWTGIIWSIFMDKVNNANDFCKMDKVVREQ